MVSTYSAAKAYELMATGEESGVWGIHLNVILQQIDINLAGVLTVPLSNANVNLTQAQAANPIIVFSGTLLANVIVTLPNQNSGTSTGTNGQGVWFLQNNTTGSFSITVQVASAPGRTLIIPQGAGRIIRSDGANLDFATFGGGLVANDVASVGQIQSGAPLYGGTSGGSANAQTVTLAPAPAALQTGQTIVFKPGFTNTGSLTVAPNGLGPYTVKKSAAGVLVNLVGGEVANGLTTAMLFDGTQLLLTDPATGVEGFLSNGLARDAVDNLYALLHGQCRLSVVDTTHLKLGPYNGQFIQISGIIYAIPAAGITALSTSCFVNGVAANPLVASTLYYVYLFNNSGTLTLDFRTGANSGHMTDTTAGNVGVEVRNNGGSPDSSRTFVGMIRTDSSAHFQDSITQRFLANWFNRQVRAVKVTTGGGNATSNTTMTAIATVEAITWNDDCIACGMVGTGSNNTNNDGMAIAPMIDGAQGLAEAAFTNGAFSYASGGIPMSVAGTIIAPSEGYHQLSAGLRANLGGIAIFTGDTTFWFLS